jgi:hypothetical protein
LSVAQVLSVVVEHVGVGLENGGHLTLVQVIDRSDTDEMSGFSTPHVDERHFSTLNADGGPSSRRLTSTRSDADPTRELKEHNKYFSALYARVFAALAADEKIAADGRLAADKKSKGFLARGNTHAAHSIKITLGFSPTSCPSSPSPNHSCLS